MTVALWILAIQARISIVSPPKLAPDAGKSTSNWRPFIFLDLQRDLLLHEGQLLMKKILVLAASMAFCGIAMADIQAPPASDFGPTRKLGRGLGNILWGSTEFFDSMAAVNYSEGNSAAWSYGIVRGLGRTFARLGYGIYEVALFPFPTQKGTYKPPYKSIVPWINSGYAEFPPELGWETRFDYARDSQRAPF